jgi:hypothetical protein
MTTPDPRIEQFLDAIKAEGRSSPAGIYWQEFYGFLRTRSKPDRNHPPVPLILGASGESDGEKHSRLFSQLEWALVNGCIAEAIDYLKKLPADHWNSCPIERWGQDSY